MQINTMGLVLRAVRVGEADQILTVLTPGNGYNYTATQHV